jgi:protein-L-isoaspartate(D-aspartate) O-methyltransferase
VTAASQTPPGERGSEAPGDPERAAERHRMLQEQIVARGIRDPALLAALARVPRHAFLPEAVRERACEDGPLPIGAGQTASQPYIVALMTEALALQRGDRVLDVGTGCGYQAAVLAEITPHVFTIEIVPELARRARIALDQHGYGNVVSTLGVGRTGWPEHAPYDAILVAAAAGQVPAALVEQLAPGGRLCLPVGPEAGAQTLLLIVKGNDGQLRQTTLASVRFVPMTGRLRGPGRA